MAFNITCYNNMSEKIVVTKKLATVQTLSNVSFKDITDILQPTLIVATPSINFNYILIPSLNNRYYYVTGVKSLNNGLWEINCRVDVLNTYSTAIKKQTAVIERQENNYNVYIDDNKFTVQNNRRVQTKEFPSGFSSTLQFALAVAGG